jgi:hypothetical protein
MESVYYSQWSELLKNRGAGSNVKRRGQPFQKGTSFFWAAIFVKTSLYGYSITCGYYGSANFDSNFEQFHSLHRAKGAK